MLKNNKNFPGINGFVWWTGIVEGRKDPLKLGRIQVRCFGWHTEYRKDDKKGEAGSYGTIDCEDLLWAQPILSANWYQNTQVPKEGEMVIGFFIDGEDAQHPFYLGVIPSIPSESFFNNKLNWQDKKPKDTNSAFVDPGNSYSEARVDKRPISLYAIDPLTKKPGPTLYPAKEDLEKPTTSRLSRNEDLQNTPIIMSSARKNGLEYGNVQYPYNSSLASESGHYFDIDDTPKGERIMLLHRSGSFIEFSANGHVRIFATNNLILMANNTVYVEACRKDIKSTAKLGIYETANTENIIEVAKLGNISETARLNISETAELGSITESAKINIVESAGSNVSETAGGNISETAGGNISETASNISNKASVIQDTAGAVIHNTPIQTTSGSHVDSVGTHYPEGTVTAAISAVSSSVSSLESSISSIQSSIDGLSRRLSALESA